MAKKALCDTPLSIAHHMARLKDAENSVLAWISRNGVAFRPLAK